MRSSMNKLKDLIALCAARLLLRIVRYRVLSERTRKSVEYDIQRLIARSHFSKSKTFLKSEKLHLGCGSRIVEGWLNVDVQKSEWDTDLASGSLPWASNSFMSIASQHVIEHLEFESELVPLMSELYRVCKPGAEIWLSCPDLKRICESYSTDLGRKLLDDRITRFPGFVFYYPDTPIQHIINDLFHQRGEHKNLFDFGLLQWMVEKAGFVHCRQVLEQEFLERYPEMPRRSDDFQSIYVVAKANK